MPFSESVSILFNPRAFLCCWFGSVGAWLGLLALAASPAAAQTCTDSTVPGFLIGFTPLTGDLTRPNSCNLLPCYKPELADGPTVEIDESCDALSGPCPVRARIALDFPGNSQLPTNTHVRVYWFDQATPDPGECLPPPLGGSCTPISVCGSLGAEILIDKGETSIQPTVSCDDIASGAYQQRSFSVSAYACQTSTGECTQRLDVPGIELPPPEELWETLECEPPPPPCDTCPCNIGGSGGSGGGPAGGGPPGWGPRGTGPKATLRYHGRGAGHPEHPGSSDWNVSLGRYWSHDYATRIVLDPDDLSEQHVWLITPGATFIEFQGLVGGNYQDVIPSDDYRQLSRTAGGWTLRELDGTVHAFDSAGLWLSTTDRNGNAKTATYDDGVLTTVNFPDSRSEIFAYHANGKLASITEVGVGGAAQRTWDYTWSGLDLVRINRPDGIAWTFRYANPILPGYMTRVTLVGTDGSERIEGAWEYDSRGNVLRTWSGDETSSGSQAIDAYRFSFDNPFRPTESQVTDPLGNITTYRLDRDPGGVKSRFTSISGDCSTCGSPNTRLLYEDPENPLMVTRSIDARGTVKLFEYDGNGRLISRTEAMGTDLERTSTWQYDETHPSLVKAMEQPSTSGSGVRRTSWTLDEAGNATKLTEEGVEEGSVFSYETATSYNSAGKPASIDPPGFGVQDRTLFAHDPTRGNLITLSRTDPVVGATTFGYDAFNRRTRTTDVNGVAAEMTYDNLDRVTSVIQKGATAEDDLVTVHVYNVLGDLFRTILPVGNLIEYGYDHAGRLISRERRPDESTHGERMLFTLDTLGNRVREDLQRWNGTGWETESFTSYEYATRCHLGKTLHADGTATEYAYDCKGNLERVWDANHPSEDQTRPATQVYSRDILDRLLSVTEPWAGEGGGNAVTSFAYDVQDHRIQITDTEGNATLYIYSDRDLVTREESPVSGVITSQYNQHGELREQTDERGVTVVRTVDALDRLLFLDYPDNGLDTTYVYDTGPFGKGRLGAITRAGKTVDYAYDRFGRLARDGALSYDYDKNGNRIEIGHPGGVRAVYSYDFANRQQSLTAQLPAHPPQPIVTGAAYLASDALTELTLGNGLTETLTLNARYFPQRLRVTGRLDWVYTTDSVGNVLSVTDRIDPEGNRTYAYQDVQYFLTYGEGPWGTLLWTYDRIGNRLGENRDGAAATYAYAPNEENGNSPRLVRSTASGGASREYFYDAIGDLIATQQEEDKFRYRYDAAGRLSEVASEGPGDPPELISLHYDGRGFLDRSTLTRFSAVEASIETTASYSSDGLLHQRGSVRRPDPTSPRDAVITAEDTTILYFADRPVAQVAIKADAEVSLTYFTTDHLGTPVLATTAGGEVTWSGGFEPFGTDWNGAAEAGVFLRFPGQWAGVGSQESESGPNVYYNVNRWYQPETGRYSRPDPIGLRAGLNLYAYVNANPTNRVDPLGLMPRPAPSSRRQTRRCFPAEEEVCAKVCGSKGVESCRVSQVFRIVRYKNGKGLWKWVDGPMSCSCNDPDEEPFCRRNPVICIGAGLGVCVLILTPWPDDVFIPPLIGAAL